MKRVAVTLIFLSVTLCMVAVIGLMRTRYVTNKISKAARVLGLKNYQQRFIRSSPAEVRRQRNKLSAMVNSMKLDLAKMACFIEDMKSKHDIMPQGESLPKCHRPESSNTARTQLDEALVEGLLTLWANQSVAIFGDPVGTYKKYLDSKHRLHMCESYDSSPFLPETSHGLVQYLDITVPQFGLPVYDWVMSLQMAEHVSGVSIDVLVDNLARHAGTGLILVWDDNTPDLNTKAQVHRGLAIKGFVLDVAKTGEMQKSATKDLVRKDVVVYKRTLRLLSPLDA